MRDSPGFKIIKELKSRDFKVAGYDPYFNPNLMQKYLKENFLEELDFELKSDISENSLTNVSCICIVQHHTKTKFRLMEIYEKSLVPFIYDCQSKIEKISESKTLFDSLGK